jgi:Mg-chelatase subunit ChlD
LDELMPQATDIAASVQRAMSDAKATRPAALVILSDGNSTTGDADRALAGAAESGVAVLWRTVAAAADSPRIDEVFVPARARPGQPIAVTVRLTGTTQRPLRLILVTRDASLPEVTAELGAGTLGSVTLSLRARRAGPLLLDVELVDAASARRVDRKELAALVDVEPPAAVMYVVDQPSPLARSLQAGGWTLTPVPSRRLDGLAAEFQQYAAVILDDVPVSAARSTTWDALARAVRDRGTGLLVLGGPRSFAAGSYRDSRLESVLPVVSRPAALGDAAAVAFVVDKSGSMGASAAGVDRLQLAQRAVVETANTLTDRDVASLVVFDVAARELIPLRAAAQFRQAVAAPWSTQPRGGTRIAPAIETAAAQLERANVTRRIIVLVTDGFVDDVPATVVRSRLSRAGIELIALAVGPDADVAALSRLSDPGHLTVLRVGEAAELPTLMRTSLEARRAPVERGSIAVRALRPLPFSPAPGSDWPPVSAYAVTSPRPDAVVHVESARGDPLIAYQQHGLGRTVAVLSGLGAWTPAWLPWRDWPALAGGLVDWVAFENAPSGLQLRAADLPMQLRVDVDRANAGRWSDDLPRHVLVQHPSGRTDRVPLEASAPGRRTVVLKVPEPGLYTFTVATSDGMQRLSHLRQPLRERGPPGPDPVVAAWRKAGLVSEWTPDALAAALRTAPASSIDTVRPLLLALLLFGCGVLLDRLPIERRKLHLPLLAAIRRRVGRRAGAPGP